jgi:hypothetical protein
MRWDLLCSALYLAEIASAIKYGTFVDPANNARMKFRYWLPDASVDIATVQSDIKAAGALGAGGVELVPLYNYGASLAGPPKGADWAAYGFGTPAFAKVFKASLQAAKDAGMRMDFAIGPSAGQGVPAETTDQGLHWDLVSCCPLKLPSLRTNVSRHRSTLLFPTMAPTRVKFLDGELESLWLWFLPVPLTRLEL